MRIGQNKYAPYRRYDPYYQRRKRRNSNIITTLAAASALSVLLYSVGNKACDLIQPGSAQTAPQGSGKTYGYNPTIDHPIYTPLDPQRHLDEAAKVRYEVQAGEGNDPSNQNDLQKNAAPTLDDKLAPGRERENYERETSLIIPRPTAGIDKTVRDALIALDLSDSVAHHLKGGIYMPAVAAIAISNYYINEKGATVAGVRFSHESDFTNFNNDLNHLAGFFAQAPVGGTALDLILLEQIANNPNRPNASKPLDLYIISDLGFQNIQDVINNLGRTSKLGRVYVLVIDDQSAIRHSLGGSPVNDTTTLFGKDAFRAPLRDYNDLQNFYRNFTQDSARPLSNP